MPNWFLNAVRRLWPFGGQSAQRGRKILRQMCMGDAGAVERLIAGEMKRAPGISEVEAYKRAILRIRHDKR